jgi:hypothetical protein
MKLHQQTDFAIGRGLILSLFLTALFLFALSPASANPSFWKFEWKKTDFSKKSIEYSEILSGGPPKDGIPSIDDPKFIAASEAKGLGPKIPVISFSMNGEAKAYPLGILMNHEIVNDTVGGVAVAVTYCPLCNSSVVFDATVNGKVTEFGTTGKLRNSDLVMYDRNTESWWQQFLGEAIVGELTGTKLRIFPSRVESFEIFKKRFPDGKVLLPKFSFRGAGGANPYGGYDTRSRPYGFFQGPLPKGINAMARVVAVGEESWALELLRKKKKIEKDNLILTWTEGQNSALDTGNISNGREVGNVVVQRKTKDGLKDVVHDITFAFVFHAFRPKGTIHK